MLLVDRRLGGVEPNPPGGVERNPPAPRPSTDPVVARPSEIRPTPGSHGGGGEGERAGGRRGGMAADGRTRGERPPLPPERQEAGRSALPSKTLASST